MKLVLFSKQKPQQEIFFDHTLDFTCPLDITNHVIGLGELTGRVQAKDERRKTPLYLCCDVCEDSNTANVKMPVLRQIMRSQGGNISSSINNIFWIEVTRNNIKSLRIYIADVDGQLQPLSNCSLNGTLIFKNAEANY